MITLTIIGFIAVLAVVLLQIHIVLQLRRLLELAETPQEERAEDKKRERLVKQWDALMTYGGDINGETKTDSDE